MCCIAGCDGVNSSGIQGMSPGARRTAQLATAELSFGRRIYPLTAVFASFCDCWPASEFTTAAAEILLQPRVSGSIAIQVAAPGSRMLLPPAPWPGPPAGAAAASTAALAAAWQTVGHGDSEPEVTVTIENENLKWPGSLY